MLLQLLKDEIRIPLQLKMGVEFSATQDAIRILMQLNMDF